MPSDQELLIRPYHACLRNGLPSVVSATFSSNDNLFHHFALQLAGHRPDLAACCPPSQSLPPRLGTLRVDLLEHLRQARQPALVFITPLALPPFHQVLFPLFIHPSTHFISKTYTSSTLVLLSHSLYLPNPKKPTFKMTGGKSGGKASGSKSAQSYVCS